MNLEIGQIISLFSIFLGLACGILLFYRMKVWKSPSIYKLEIELISVIIPARNEENNLKGLLQDLQKQTYPNIEVICIDDDSTDGTYAIAKQYNAKVLQVKNKPEGWIGKSFACSIGVQNAQGSIFLFLDADVRLAPNAIEEILQRKDGERNVVSVQPKHMVKKWYEQLSLFFNMIGGIALTENIPFSKGTAGLFGPVICISKSLYQEIGGHQAVKESILDDISLGKELQKIEVVPSCYIGNPTITFRMYPNEMKEMNQGWIKNFAAGAGSSSLFFLVITVIWVSGLIRTPLELVNFVVSENILFSFIYAIIYFLQVIVLYFPAKKIGNFKNTVLFLYPIPLLYFLLIFCISLYKKVFHRSVSWKGRKY